MHLKRSSAKRRPSGTSRTLLKDWKTHPTKTLKSKYSIKKNGYANFFSCVNTAAFGE